MVTLTFHRDYLSGVIDFFHMKIIFKFIDVILLCRKLIWLRVIALNNYILSEWVPRFSLLNVRREKYSLVYQLRTLLSLIILR